MLTVPIDPIIPAREIFLQPDIEADEQIAAAHFLDLEFRLAGAAVAPSDGDHGEGKSSDDGFEGKLDRDVEVRREDWALQSSGIKPAAVNKSKDASDANTPVSTWRTHD